MSLVYLAIGSNLGDREANCLRAVGLLPEYGVAVRKQSSFYESEPWGVKDQPRFINIALEAETSLGPHLLLYALKAIEKEMGRVDAGHWGPRVMDIDILLYDNVIIKEPGLSIPHPHMLKRDFVLKPLKEIAPDVLHPVMGKKIRELPD
jgi:2-amino-4-hydroxy-6-hydroxymethyldihydropteridine diphosphokinase